MPEKIEIGAQEPAVGEWVASLVVIFACAAFALLLARGPRPAMDRAQLDPAPAASEHHATASGAPAPLAASPVAGG
jgi:hypothetical protein